MKKSKAENANVWKNIMEKVVSNDKFPLSTSITHDDKLYDVQIFEVLAAETLNLHDTHVRWQVTKAGGDGGIDLIGYERRESLSPFIAPFQLISLGQVKRRGTSYRYDNFKSDVGKVNEYCLKTNFFQDKSLKQLLFVISTPSITRVQSLRTRMNGEDNAWLANQKSSYIGFISSDDLVKSWKLNYSHFEQLLQEALTPTELSQFKEYVDQYDFSWISASVISLKSCGVMEPVTQTVKLQVDTNDIDIDVVVRWIPPEPLKVQMVHPLRLCDPRQSGFPVHIHKESQLTITFRGLEAGKLDFGVIELHSPISERLLRLKLEDIEVYDGFFLSYYDEPNQQIMREIEGLCIDTRGEFLPILVHGCGGIGKSSLISEVLIHAASKGFSYVDVAQPKDRHHGRFIIKELLKSIAFPNQTNICFDSSLTREIRKHMGVNYNPDWEDDLNSFLLDDVNCKSRSVAECVVSAILIAAIDAPVLLWLSDLHWLSEEAANILNIVIDELNANQKNLNHRVLLLLEGRDNECILVDNRPFFPAQWHALMENTLLHRFHLKIWNLEACKFFLNRLFLISAKEIHLYDTLIEQILKKASGVPMHMVELVKTLLEKENVILSEGQRLLIVNQNYAQCLSENILTTIQNRIRYYQTIVSDFIDVLIIFAYLNCEIPGRLISFVMNWLEKKYESFHRIKKLGAFIVEQNDRISFSHEHYHTAFRSLAIQNDDVLNKFITYYKNRGYLLESEQFALITLQKHVPKINCSDLRKDIISFIKRNPSRAIRLSLYEYLLELPPLEDAVEDFPTYYVLFQLCELNVQGGSWKTARYYLQRQLELPYQKEHQAIVYTVKAKQEMANILADQLQFEMAVREAESGIELSDLWLEKSALTPQQYSEILREKAKLLARLAVCYWFAGNLEKASAFQKQSYQIAVQQKDSYAAMHVLYEIGTLEFHKRCDIGLYIMEYVKDRMDEIPVLKKHEETLIEVQTLIGMLIKAAAEDDTTLLKKVRLASRELAEGYKTTPHTYEEFLCHTIRGIIFILEDNWSEALVNFFSSLKKATEGDMPNLEWKALFNIAQLYWLQSSSAALPYAKKARRLLDSTKKDNPNFSSCLIPMLQPVYNRLDLIENGLDWQGAVADEEQALLAVKIKGSIFVIMN